MRELLLLGLVVACGSSQEPAGADAPPAGGDAATSIDATTAVTCEGRTAQPLDATWSVVVGGVTRTARVHVPASYQPMTRTPVVINIHGLTGSASQQQLVSKMIAKSDAAGFIAVHPEGTGTPRSWNAGGCCSPASTEGVDDIGFMRTLLDELEQQLCVDPDRVYATGLSNGGHMSYRIACELADRVAAVASVAGILHFSPCQPSRAVPVLDVHGTADTIVSYSYVPATIEFWRTQNKTTTTQTTYQHGDATCETHAGGADVVLCTIDGGGHQWPGGEAIPFMGKKSDDLIATDAIWTFFAAHPRTTTN